MKFSEQNEIVEYLKSIHPGSTSRKAVAAVMSRKLGLDVSDKKVSELAEDQGLLDRFIVNGRFHRAGESTGDKVQCLASIVKRIIDELGIELGDKQKKKLDSIVCKAKWDRDTTKQSKDA